LKRNQIIKKIFSALGKTCYDYFF